MTRLLLVAVAHGMDLLTFLMAASVFGIDGEWGASRSVIGAGLVGIVALKAFGTLGLVCLTQLRRWAFVPAAASGLIYASINLIAIRI